MDLLVEWMVPTQRAWGPLLRPGKVTVSILVHIHAPDGSK